MPPDRCRRAAREVPLRAKSGGFDLGLWDDRTLYGSETGLRLFAERVEGTGGAVIADLVWNHNGFQYDDTPGFQLAGGYPGTVLQNPDGGSDPVGVPGTNGDFLHPTPVATTLDSAG